MGSDPKESTKMSGTEGAESLKTVSRRKVCGSTYLGPSASLMYACMRQGLAIRA